jgi:hypothetical protein
MNKVFLVTFAATIFLCCNAFAGETIKVQADSDPKSISDVKSLLQLQMATAMIITPCYQQTIIDMKKSGKTDQDIDKYMANPSLQEKCKCINENKAMLTEQLKNYDAIISRHPDWKGKNLTAKEANGLEIGTDTAFMEDIRKQLAECP